MKTLLTSILIVFFAITAYANPGQSVTYRINDQIYEGYFVSPSPKAPLVFIVHDWDGLTEYEKKRAHMMADSGYAVFAMDLFGKGVRPTEVKDKRHLTGELYKDREKMRTLMNGAYAKAESMGADTTNAVAAGYCFGGAAILEWARSGKNMKGFAAFHGGLETPENQNYKNTTGQIIVFHGSADTVATMDHFAGLAKELESASISHEMTTYSGAPHAFTVFGSGRYHEKADKASWSRFLSFLKDTVKQ